MEAWEISWIRHWVQIQHTYETQLKTARNTINPIQDSWCLYQHFNLELPNLDPSSDRFVRNNVFRTKRARTQLTWVTYFLLFTCSACLNVVYMKTIAISALHSVLPWVLPTRTRTSPFTFVYIFPSSCQKILPEIARVLQIDTYWMFVYFKLTLYCVVL